MTSSLLLTIIFLFNSGKVASSAAAESESVSNSTVNSNTAETTTSENNDYQRYSFYPPYCSTPQEMEKRAIPPLQMYHGTGNKNDSSDSDDINKQGTQLLHVTALIRHGARTPWAGPPDYQCWNGYFENEETGIWNCDLRTYMSPPQSQYGGGQFPHMGKDILVEEPDFLFEKRYDALTIQSTPDGSVRTGNSLQGTCQLGQLLSRGYHQEFRNGAHIRQAYFYDGDNTADEHAAKDPRMRLWDLAGGTDASNAADAAKNVVVGDPTKLIFQEPNLRYRADDEQRTLMSGQILLRGLFGPELSLASQSVQSNGETVEEAETAIIPLHTADYTKDVLSPYQESCPRLAQLRNESYYSEEFRKWNETSAEAKIVKNFAKEKLGMESLPISLLDCLMTTICTDRPLPTIIDDYDGSIGPTSWEDDEVQKEIEFSNMFERLANYAVKRSTFPYIYNDAEYSKLGMGPLWKEIMSNILPIVGSNPNNWPTSSFQKPPPKLALISGHDTTLMPILASLGKEVWSGTEWASYASMVLIEIHKIVNSGRGSDFPSGFAFRLIYNGKVLTAKMDGCPPDSDLCDSQVLVKQVTPFAKYKERDCALDKTTSEDDEKVSENVLVTKTKEAKRAAENLVSSPGGVLVVLGLVILSTMLGCVVTIFFMRRRYRKAYDYKESMALRELSMTDLEDDEDFGGQSNSQTYGATIEEAVESDENRII